MKKLLALMALLLVASMLLVACEKDPQGGNQETTDEVTTPEETTPEETTPEDTTPEDTTPEDTTPEDTTPEDTTPEETTPEPVKVVAGLSFDAMGKVSGGEIDMDNLFFASATEYATWDKVANVDHLVDSIKVLGWVAFFTETEGSIGYSIDGAASVYPEGFATPAEQDVLDYVSSSIAGGKSAARFFSDVPVADLAVGEHTVALMAKDADGNEEAFAEFKLVKVDNSYRVDFASAPISGSYAEPWIASNLIPSMGADELIYVMHYGSVDLGEMDLSQYKKVVVTYATPVGFDANGGDFGEQYNATAQRVMLLNTASNVQDGTAFEYLPADEAIIASAHYDMSSVNLEFKTVEIDLSEIDYNGQTYLTFDFRNAENAFGATSYLVVVSGIVFM